LGPLLAVILLCVAGFAVHRDSGSERHARGYTLSSLVVSIALLVSLVHQSYDATITVRPLVVIGTVRRFTRRARWHPQ